jgi:hypothetical protein
LATPGRRHRDGRGDGPGDVSVGVEVRTEIGVGGEANRLGEDLAERTQLDFTMRGDRQRLNRPIGHIYKYYLAYRLVEEIAQEQDAARRAAETAPR